MLSPYLIYIMINWIHIPSSHPHATQYLSQLNIDWNTPWFHYGKQCFNNPTISGCTIDWRTTPWIFLGFDFHPMASCWKTHAIRSVALTWSWTYSTMVLLNVPQCLFFGDFAWSRTHHWWWTHNFLWKKFWKWWDFYLSSHGLWFLVLITIDGYVT